MLKQCAEVPYLLEINNVSWSLVNISASNNWLYYDVRHQKKDPDEVLRSKTDRGDGKKRSEACLACRGASGVSNEELKVESKTRDISKVSGRLALKFFFEWLTLPKRPSLRRGMLMVADVGVELGILVSSGLWHDRQDCKPSSPSSFGGQHDSREDCKDMSHCVCSILRLTLL